MIGIKIMSGQAHKNLLFDKLTDPYWMKPH